MCNEEKFDDSSYNGRGETRIIAQWEEVSVSAFCLISK
jgi:hypothetical protein